MLRQLSLHGTLVSFEDYGGKGAPVVFLHGWRSRASVWAGAAGALGEIARCVALDLPGFGSSEAPRSVWTLSDYAGVVREFLEKESFGPSILVGHSFGGRVAAKLAAEAPALVSKLVLVDSAGFPAPAAKKAAFGFVAKLVGPLFRPRFMQPLRRLLYRAIGAEDYVATPGLVGTFVRVVNEDLSEHLRRVRCPALLVWGSRDADTPLSTAERMLKLLPEARLSVLQGAGHFSFLDEPGQFVASLREFITDQRRAV